MPLPTGEPSALSDRERAVLDFERQWWAHPGRRDDAVRELFDCSPADYRRELSALIDRPEARLVEPRTVARLRRARARRVAERGRSRGAGAVAGPAL